MAVAITTAMQNQIAQNYIAILGRNPDPAGFSFWVQTYADANGTPAALTSITNGFGNSAEFRGTYAGLTTNDAVALMYQNVLLRAADAPGLTYWAGIANGLIARGETISNAYAQTGAQMIYTASANGTSDSASINARTATAVASGSAAPITTYTLTTAPETLSFNQNTTVNGVIDFAGGTTAGALTTLNSSDSITMAGASDRLNVTLRNANGTALGSATAAVRQVNTVTITGVVVIGDTIQFTYNGVQLNTAGATATDVTAAAAAVVSALNSYAGSAIAANAAGVITVTAATAGVGFNLGGFTAKIANQSVGAEQFATAFTTANVAASGGNISLGSLTGVETLAIQNVSGSAVTVSAAQAPGHTGFVNDRSTSDVTVSNLANGASVTINGDGSTTQQGALTATYTAAATTAGALSITGGANAGAVTFTPNAQVTTVTVNSTGGAQASSGGQVNTFNGLTLPTNVTSLVINAATSLTTGTIADASLTTITASGAATTVSLTTTVPTSIDGSGLTAGGISMTLGTGVTSFKGGAGTDTITTAATTAANAVIDAGAGTGDILALAATNDVTTTQKAAQYQNFEILRSSVNGIVDMSLFPTYTAVQSNATGAGFSNMTATQANAVTARASGGAVAGATYSLANSAGLTDVLRVTLSNSTSNTGSTTAEDLTTVTVNGFETMNIVSTSGTNGSVSAVSFTAATDLTALNISGVAPLSLTTTNIVKGVTIDASAMTFVPSSGNRTFAITGNLIKGSIVTATGASDSITATAAVAGTTNDFVTYNAGAGSDAISATVAAINNTSAGNASVKIDGGAGTDTLTLTDNGITMVDANFQFLTNIEAIAYAVANQAISITAGGFFDTNFKSAGVTMTLGDATNAQVNTVNLSTFTGNAIVSLTASTASTQVQTISTGSGNDTVTLLAAGTTTAAHVVSTGAGNDTINVTIAGATIVAGTVTINGGAGQDTTTITGNSVAQGNAASNVIYRVNEGQSTLTASDAYNGWVLTAGNLIANTIDFDGTAVAAADVASSVATGFTNVNYAITSGLLSFTGTGATGLTAANKATIAQTFVTAADATVAFTDGGNTYVFHNGVTIDDLVNIVGVSGTGLQGGAGTTNSFIQVA